MIQKGRANERLSTGPLSQEALGEIVGVTQSAVAAWEGGTAFPTVDTLLKIAQVLELDLNELVALVDEPLSAA